MDPESSKLSTSVNALCPETHRGLKKPGEIRELVIKLAAENPGWGYTKIRDALRGLKIELARKTVTNILKEAGVQPAPERNRKRTWKHFLRSHWDTLYAANMVVECDIGTEEQQARAKLIGLRMTSRISNTTGSFPWMSALLVTWTLL